MKSKNAPQRIPRRLLNYSPLLIALGIIGVWAWLLQYASRFPDPNNRLSFSYPLVEIANNFELLFAIVCALIVILHGIALRLGSIKVITILSLFAMIGMSLFWLLVGSLETAHLKERDTIAINGNSYRLIHITNGWIWGYSYPIEAYTVLACDDSLSQCGYFSTPYLKERSHPDDFPKNARLEIDPVTDRLMLYVGEDIIDVQSTEDILMICGDIREQHTDRNRNIDTQGYVCS